MSMYFRSGGDSFVMIDMKKYRIGQLIQGQVELKDIRPDSLVMRYQGQTFKIKRP